MISDVEFAEAIQKSIKDRRNDLKEQLAMGKLGESHDQVALRYRDICGEIRGLDYVDNEVKEIIKRANYGGKD